jgi:hypothetical protein
MERSMLWTHGVSFIPSNSSSFPELPPQGALSFVNRVGYGAEFTPNVSGRYDFLVFIPTATILGDDLQRLKSITPLFDAVDATIDSVGIFDGEQALGLDRRPSGLRRDESSIRNPFQAFSRGLVVTLDVNLALSQHHDVNRRPHSTVGPFEVNGQ